MSKPLVSVVMPAYNTASFIADSINSILNQSYPHIELIVVDDGSTDDTATIIKSFEDKRLRLIENQQNSGNAFCRNMGIMASQGKYIMHMDSDDTSPLYRIEKQVKFLQSHPDVDIVGGYALFVYPQKKRLKKYFIDPKMHETFLFFKNTLLQATVMMRKSLFDEYAEWYYANEENMEDYSLWYRLSLKDAKMTVIPKRLLNYRQWHGQLSNPDRLDQRKALLREFFKKRLESLDLSLSEPDFDLLHSFIRGRIEINNERFDKLNYLLNLLKHQNYKVEMYENDYFGACLLFFRTRLLKYFYLEFKKDRIAFTRTAADEFRKAGLRSTTIFFNNLGRF